MKFKKHDIVILNFGNSGKLFNCFISEDGIKKDGRELYNVVFTYQDRLTMLHDIDVDYIELKIQSTQTVFTASPAQ